MWVNENIGGPSIESFLLWVFTARYSQQKELEVHVLDIMSQSSVITLLKCRETLSLYLLPKNQ